MPKRRRNPLTLLSSLLVIVIVGTALMAPLATPARAEERTFSLNFKRSFVDKLIKRVAEETGRTILFDEQVRGNISVITKRPVTEREAWAILEASLSILGYSLLPSTVGNWRIAKVADAVGEAPFAVRPDPESDAFVTTLISLETADLQAVLDVLEPISGSRVTLVPYHATNCLIASGPQRAIARLTSIADELDRVDELTLRYRVLRYRDVAEVEPLIEARIASLGASARQLQVWSDERTNSVLFRGRPDDISDLSRFIDRVDRPIEGSGQIRVLRVLNRDPEELANLMRELAGSPSTARGAKIASDIRSPGSQLTGAEFTIAVDRASRSLVVRASPDVQIAIRDLLEELDVPPQLIAVDVTITEIRTPQSQSLGFAFSVPLTAVNDDKDLIGRLISTPVPGAIFAQQPGPETTVYGRVARDTGVTIAGPLDSSGNPTAAIPIEDTGVIQGGSFDIQVEVLIQPHLIVIAGERHEIFVGNNVPVPVTEGRAGEVDGNSAFGISISQTTRFDRTDIGVRLGIEATAGATGKIQLDLDVEISSLSPDLAGPIESVGPSFLKETLIATARLDHGETAIIGVNRQSKQVKGRSGVPWLSSIPFLGWLFSSDLDTTLDVRLVIAARARRVASPAALVAQSIRRRLAFQRRAARDGVFVSSDALPFGVRVTTRALEKDAEAIAEGLSFAGHQTVIHPWTYGSDRFFDVYVVSLESMADAAEIANGLTHDGWDPDLVLLRRNVSAL